MTVEFGRKQRQEDFSVVARDASNIPGKPVQVFADPNKHRRRIVIAALIAIVYLASFWATTFGLRIYQTEKVSPLVASTPAAVSPIAAKSLFFPTTGQKPEFAGPPLPEGMAATAMGTCNSNAPLGTEGDLVASLAPAALSGATAPLVPLNLFLHLNPELQEDVSLTDAKLAVTRQVMPEWFTYSSEKKTLGWLNPNPFRRENTHRLPGDLSEDANITPITRIAFNEYGAKGPDPLHDPLAASQIVHQIGMAIRENDLTGMCLFPTRVGADDIAPLRTILTAARRKLSPLGKETCLVGYSDQEFWKVPGLADLVDRFVVLGFHQPDDSVPPRPLAPQAWFEATVKDALATVGPDKLIIGLGTSAVDWISGEAEPQVISYGEAMSRAKAHDGIFDYGGDIKNTSIRMIDDQGRRHQIWMLDAVSMHNQMTTLSRLGVRNAAIWSGGSEDPSLWNMLGAENQVNHRAIEEIDLVDTVSYDGDGVFHSVAMTAESGRRSLSIDLATGLIDCQSYSKIPSPYTIRRTGKTAADTVVLTFDDGPDPVFTKQVLDILKQEDVTASFFVVGQNAMLQRDLIRRMYDEGHEIGSHTFFHPKIEDVPQFRTEMELNALQRLVASITGRKMALFRTPYGHSDGPADGHGARPAILVQELGYTNVGADIVPPDWTKISAEEMVEFTLEKIRTGDSNVVMLHDGGGDRSTTVEALPLMIRALKEAGYSFVSLADVMNTDRNSVMPALEDTATAFDTYSFTALAKVSKTLGGIFTVIVIAALLRYLTILTLAFLRKPPADEVSDFLPSVTVVIAAYNEEMVILPSLETVLGLDYPNLKVIVVDDGSTDRTYKLVMRHYDKDPRVSMIRQRHQGKWQALNTAYAFVDTDIVVSVDADTVIMPDAIRKLVPAFEDPEVGAVAGMVRIGNRDKLITKLQAIEYITAQNIDRRAAEVYNGMMVVPGAIGAWRTSAVRDAGLYTGVTMTEDADLTIAILRAGYRNVFAPEAVAITEVPDTVNAFLKQRLRWGLGMMQTAWKHRGAAREGRAVGLISIPDLWIFGVALTMLAPLADLILLSSLVWLGYDLVQGQPLFQNPIPLTVVAAYLVLPLFDFIGASIAFCFDRKESARLLFYVPLYRLLYRPLLYYSLYRALWRALSGQLAGWGKLIRRGTVRLPQAPAVPPGYTPDHKPPSVFKTMRTPSWQPRLRARGNRGAG